jgi:hypothetical protein
MKVTACLHLTSRFRRSLYRSGSITTGAREFARYKIDSLGVQEVRWDKGGTVRAGDYIFLWKRKQKSSIENRILYTSQNGISIKTVQSASKRKFQHNHHTGNIIFRKDNKR